MCQPILCAPTALTDSCDCTMAQVKTVRTHSSYFINSFPFHFSSFFCMSLFHFPLNFQCIFLLFIPFLISLSFFFSFFSFSFSLSCFSFFPFLHFSPTSFFSFVFVGSCRFPRRSFFISFLFGSFFNFSFFVPC